MKIGEIIAYGGDSAPNNFMICDGSAVSRTTYAPLFAVIGETFGAGDGSTTFNIPNMKSSVAVSKDSGDPDFDFGDTGGSNSVGSHSHSHSHTHAVSGTLPAGASVSGDDGSYDAVADNAHTHTFNITTNSQSDENTDTQLDAELTANPFVTINYLIAASYDVNEASFLNNLIGYKNN